MKRLIKFACLLSLVLGAVFLSVQAAGQVPPGPSNQIATGPPASSSETAPAGLRPFAEAIAGATRLDGLFTLYQNLEANQAYLALRPDQLNQNFLLLATLESGLGEAGLFRGWPVSDFLVQFRRIPGNRVQVVVPNLSFRTNPRSPEEQRLLTESFSDSPIATLNLVSVDSASGELLLDFGAFLLTRDPAALIAQFPWIFGSYSPNPDGSYLEPSRVFAQNIETSAILNFTGGSSDPLALLFSPTFASLPDSRGFNLRLRYSLTQVPNNPSYRPRLADQRVGYFVTTFRTPARLGAAEPYTRYIHRWHLEKQDPAAALSAPKQPIVFWLENTVPREYRQAIAEGALMWNEAFERAGFQQAIEVRQMPDDADWDPADIRYSVIRWSDSLGSGILGYGPSRVNPLTGEIFDADVVLDANAIRYLQQEYRQLAEPLAFRPETYLQLCNRQLQTVLRQRLQSPAASALAVAQGLPLAAQGAPDPADRCASFEAGQQVAFGGLALNLLGAPFSEQAALKTYANDYLRALTAHEVGHVLGLRHNFLGSTLLAPEALNDPQISRSQGLVSSVMDYAPPNLAPPTLPQGEYFPTRLGAYDLWAVEYGYKPISGPPQTEAAALAAIAGRSTAPELAYATDEDIFDFLNPQAGAWDLSSDPLTYAQWQMDNAQAIWQKLNWYSVSPGQGYGQLRRHFDLVMSYYLNQTLRISNYIGGQRFSRIDPWQSRGQLPFTPIPAEKQRQALDRLAQYVFAPTAFEFSPDLLNSLAPDRWDDLSGNLTIYPLDYPIYDRILFIQGMALNDLFYAERLRRLRDAELKAGAADSLTLPELFERTGQMIWAEIWASDAQPVALSSLRRGLQRHHLSLLSSLVLRRGFEDVGSAQDVLEATGILYTVGAPEDARVLARRQLQQLDRAIATYLSRQGTDLDLSSQAHLEDVRDRISKVLEAPLQGA